MKANYEIDFVGNDSKGDADAIAFRWKDRNGKYRICIYDCGTETQAEKMIELLNDYYFCDIEEKIIDAIIISHPDGDHINGITKIMDEFQINTIFVNAPWDYSEELADLSENYKSADYLSSRLKNSYKKLSEIIDLAYEYGICVLDALQGTKICDELLVLSPSREDYIEHLLNSGKTPVRAMMESHKSNDYENDNWNEDNLLENPTTTEENETSVVVWGLCSSDEKRFILLGDAGVLNINEALDYASEFEVKNKTVFYQVPHHGGRHNLDTDTMNRLVGDILGKDSDSGKRAYVSVGIGSDHPRQCIVNAYKRRGVKVYKTKGNIIHYYVGDMPAREGWVKLKELEFLDTYTE